MGWILNTAFNLGFALVYYGLGRLLFGREFGTPTNPVEKWKVMVLGAFAFVVGFGVFVLSVSAITFAFKSYSGFASR
jgi:hypothetical protein